MSLLKNLLQVVDNQKVTDYLLKNLKSGRYQTYSPLEINCEPTPKAAEHEIISNGSAKAVAIADISTDANLLDKIAKRETRRTVLRTIARNKSTRQDTLLGIIAKALKKQDQETLTAAAGNLTTANAVKVITAYEATVEEHSARSVANCLIKGLRWRGLSNFIGNEISELLKCSNQNFVIFGLEISFGADASEALIKTALAEANLPKSTIAAELWDSACLKSKDSAQFLLDNIQVDSQLETRNVTMGGSLTTAGAELFSVAGDTFKRSGFSTDTISDELFYNLIKLSGDDALGWMGNYAAEEAFKAATKAPNNAYQANLLADTIVAYLSSSDDGVTISHSKFIRFHYYSLLELLTNDHLSGEHLLALLRMGSSELTVSWAARTSHTAVKDPPELIMGGLLESPQWAFTTANDQEVLTDTREIQNVLVKIVAKLERTKRGSDGYTQYLVKNAPGVVGAILGNRTGTYRATHRSGEGTLSACEAIYNYLFSVFGTEEQLWQALLSFGENYPGTMVELVKMCSASTGIPISTDQAEIN